MIEVEEIEGGLRVVDAAKNEVELEIEDWEPGGEELEIGREVDKVLTGSASQIHLSHEALLVESDQLEERRTIFSNNSLKLDLGRHLFQISSIIPIYIRSNSRIDINAGQIADGIDVIFRSDEAITFGIKSLAKVPPRTVQIPPTTHGLSSALMTLSETPATDTPDRSFPSKRPTLPILEIDENARPLDTERQTTQHSIIFRIPDSFDFLYPLAPLSFYLDAEITLEDRDRPLLETEELEYDFCGNSNFGLEASSLLYRVFYLDCLVREAGNNSVGLKEFSLLDDLELEPDDVYDMPISRRLSEYLGVSFERIEEQLPEWPLSVHVEPSLANVPIIPFLLERLAFVFLPNSRTLDRRGIIERSLDGIQRSTIGGMGLSEERIVRIAASGRRTSTVHGWIADDIPIDAFKSPPRALTNHHRTSASRGPIKVALILNDGMMKREYTDVKTTYKNRSEEISIELNIFENVTRNDLADIIGDGYDFLHYIGHCDQSGLRCTDGNLATDDLSTVRTRTFFLNACDSFKQGLNLIRMGSIVGGVTVSDVVDEQAMRVGSTFARLLMHGFPFERSLYYARRRSIMNRNYAALGDGTYVLTQGGSVLPSVSHATRLEDGRFMVQIDATPLEFNGGFTQPWTDANPHLMGNHRETIVSSEAFQDLIENLVDPFIYEDKFYWPEELLDELF